MKLRILLESMISQIMALSILQSFASLFYLQPTIIQEPLQNTGDLALTLEHQHLYPTMSLPF